jgi:integrase
MPQFSDDKFKLGYYQQQHEVCYVMETLVQEESQQVKPKKEKKPKARARRGSGSIYQPEGSRFYWIKYYRNGQAIRESSKSELKSVAQSLLDTRRKEMQQGANPAISNKLTYEDIRQGLLDFYRNQKRRSLRTADADIKRNNKVVVKKGEQYVWGLPNLDNFFAGHKVQNITVGVLQSYVKERKAEGSDGSTIAREFRILRSAMNLARKFGQIQYVPHFPMPKENDPRQGFVEHAAFNEVLDQLPKHLHALAILLYSCGVRVGEAKQITWSQVDLKRGEIRLGGSQTKNGQPRVLPLNSELLGMLKKQFQDDRPVFDATNLRKAWKKATKDAGIPGLLIHDLRRSAVRNLRKEGVPESVAMKISGHKTNAVFRRYDIVDSSDVHAAMKAVENAAKAQKAANAENG